MRPDGAVQDDGSYGRDAESGDHTEELRSQPKPWNLDAPARSLKQRPTYKTMARWERAHDGPSATLDTFPTAEIASREWKSTNGAMRHANSPSIWRAYSSEHRLAIEGGERSRTR